MIDDNEHVCPFCEAGIPHKEVNVGTGGILVVGACESTATKLTDALCGLDIPVLFLGPTDMKIELPYMTAKQLIPAKVEVRDTGKPHSKFTPKPWSFKKGK